MRREDIATEVLMLLRVLTWQQSPPQSMTAYRWTIGAAEQGPWRTRLTGAGLFDLASSADAMLEAFRMTPLTSGQRRGKRRSVRAACGQLALAGLEPDPRRLALLDSPVARRHPSPAAARRALQRMCRLSAFPAMNGWYA